jgi:signal transduction histidine kinase
MAVGERMTTSFLPRVLFFAGVSAWLCVCIATPAMANFNWKLGAWVIASALFIVSFLWNAGGRAFSLVALALQSAAIVSMVALLCNGLEGLLLVMVAAQLGMYGHNRLALVWIAVQTLALAGGIALNWGWRPALLLTPPYLGFQLILYVAVRLFVDERRSSTRLAEANEALMKLQSELARRTRVEERLRISQEMHDVLGHHLTALSLNLELAAHESQGDARDTIRTAQSLARGLLNDVKTLVRSADDDVPVDLQHEIAQLARDLPRPKLHVSCDGQLDMPDARTSRALFRVVQEIVTNAIRHGAARNLWIAIERKADRVGLVARDDGESGGATAEAMAEGFGLSGMRRRLEELGGTLVAAPAASGGFEVRAELPWKPAA